MRCNCVAGKAEAAFYFSWLNKKRKIFAWKTGEILAIRNDILRVSELFHPIFLRIRLFISARLSIAVQAVYKDRHGRLCRPGKKLPLKSTRSKAASSGAPLGASGIGSMREPTQPPAFGKFGAKAPVAAAVLPTGSKRLENVASRIQAVLSSHGRLALTLFVLLWVTAVAAFVLVKA